MWIGERAAVVVGELHQDKIAGLHIGEDLVPDALGQISAAAATAARAVFDLDFVGVKPIRQRRAPALETFVGIVDTVESPMRKRVGTGWLDCAGKSLPLHIRQMRRSHIK